MKTLIEWVRNKDGTQGYTINPVKGLCPMACPYCYARRMYKRFKWNPEVRFDPIILTDPFCYPKPSKIFVGSTIELFGDWIKPAWIEMILEFCQRETNKRHTFIFLTKQPQNLIKWSPFPENCWVGVTATDNEMAFNASANLISVKAKMKFLSIEPLLGSISKAVLDLLTDKRGINWLIPGTCTGTKKEILELHKQYPELTPMQWKGALWTLQPPIEWLREIVEAADKAGIPVFLKNNLEPLLGQDKNYKKFRGYDGEGNMLVSLRHELPGD